MPRSCTGVLYWLQSWLPQTCKRPFRATGVPVADDATLLAMLEEGRELLGRLLLITTTELEERELLTLERDELEDDTTPPHCDALIGSQNQVLMVGLYPGFACSAM